MCYHRPCLNQSHRTVLRFVVASWLGALPCAVAVNANAQEPSQADSAVGELDLKQLLARRATVAEEISALRGKGGEGAADADPTEVSAAEDEREFLESLDGVLGQQQARLEQRQELLAEKKLADAELETLRRFGPTEPKPYSFLLLENLRDELAGEEEQGETLAADLTKAEQLAESAQENLDDAEAERRLAQEALDENEDDEEQAALENDLKLAKRQSQLAKENIPVRRLEMEVRTLRNELCKVRRTYFEEKIERLAGEVRFTKRDLQDRLKELASFEAELREDLRAARARFQQTEAEQNAAVKRLREESASQATIDLAQESWRVARDAQQAETTLLSERISDTKRFHHYWGCRYEVENGTATSDQLQEWQESVSDLVDEIQENRLSLQQRIETTLARQAKLVQRMRNSDDAAVEQWGEFQNEKWQRLRDVCETHLVHLKVNERWARRFLEELEAQIEPPSQRRWWHDVRDGLVAGWRYEVFHVDDRPITLGKLAGLVLYLPGAVLLAGLLSRLLGRHVLPRLGLNEGAAHAVQSMSYYSLSILLVLLAFQLVHIPLTAFAFLGGAVAIAVGFGSQEIASNFMSGIIILAEQPIRVGDVVVVDGVQGTVEHIGPRSTRLRTESNHELIVPNSKLLAEQVTNLTLSDNLVQTAISVSLPTKLPVKQAKGLLLQAALGNPQVLREPHPVVIFKSFGSTSMEFQLHFWLQLSDDMQVAVAQSDVREAIEALFQQNDAPPTIAAAPSLQLATPPAVRSSNAA